MIFEKPIVSEKDDDYVVEANFQREKRIAIWEANSFNEHKAEKDDCPICHGDRWIAEAIVEKDKVGRNAKCYAAVKRCSCFSKHYPNAKF